MALVASNKNTSRVAAPALVANNYMARVVQVIDVGVQPQRAYQKQEKPPVQQIRVTYELGTEFLEGDESKPRWISEQFPLYSLGSELAKSTKRYLAIDPSKAKGGDWSKLVGDACLVQVTEYEKKDGTTGNGVGSVAAPINGVPVPELVNEGSFFDMDAPDMDLFTTFPDWLKGVLTEECLSYEGSALHAALGGASAPAPEQDNDVDEDMPV